MNDFTSMYKIIPRGKSGEYGIKHHKITKQDVKHAEIRSIIHLDEVPPKAGTATVLYKKTDSSWRDEECVMSDTEFEKETNRSIFYFSGRVLIGGLGIGMILLPLIKNKNVTKITVVEKEKDVINLVSEHIKKFDKRNKLEVIHDDIFNIEFPKGIKFDTIYFDIWNNVCGDNYEIMKQLKKRFRKYRSVGCKILCWQEEKTKEYDKE